MKCMHLEHKPNTLESTFQTHAMYIPNMQAEYIHAKHAVNCYLEPTNKFIATRVNKSQLHN